MADKLENKILNFLQTDLRRDYTIPEIMSSVGVKNRERIVATLVRLEERNLIEISRLKGGRIKYYRIKTTK